MGTARSVGFVILIAMVASSDAARILCVFPFPAHSHQLLFRFLTMELAKRGHEVIVFTPKPAKPALANYTEIDMSFLTSYYTDIYPMEAKLFGMRSFLYGVYNISRIFTEAVYAHPVMQQLIRPDSNEKFDLIIVQLLFLEGLLALAERFDAPVVGVSTLAPTSPNNNLMGNPPEIAYYPNILTDFTDDMNFWERIQNLYWHLFQTYDNFYYNLPQQEMVIRKYFGDTMPSIIELQKRVALVVYGSHAFFTYPRPNVQPLIFMGGSRKKILTTKLPQDLKKILDDSKEGFIYFSLGSNLQSSRLPKDMMKSLVSIFSELPYRVIWKFEADLPNKSDNVVLIKWAPQEAILAHPNILLFMYQGGYQSTEEAIHYAVPMIGFPVFSDQSSNVRRLVHAGGAKMFDILDFDKDELKNAIIEMTTDKRYKENMIKFRNLLYDLPYDPLNNTIWWVEYVIRHKGAPHLSAKSRDLPFYKLHLLDIFLFFLVILLFTLYLAVILLRCAFRLVRKLFLSRNANTSKKEQ